MKNSPASQEGSPALICAMFDRIAPTYDLLNRLISFGLDRSWRNRAIAAFPSLSGGKFLDIAAGSGDVTLALLEKNPGLVVGTDFSLNMLRLSGQKLRSAPRNSRAGLAASDALSLPFRDGSFDGTIVAFGIRNFADRPLALREMFRVLKTGGTSVILELTVPGNPLAAGLYKFHAKLILPLLGRIISGDRSAYSYLPGSIDAFPPPGQFLGLMIDAGFVDTAFTTLSFGTATIFRGGKP